LAKTQDKFFISSQFKLQVHHRERFVLKKVNLEKLKRISVRIFFCAFLVTIFGAIAAALAQPVATYLLALKLQRDVILSTPLVVTDVNSATHLVNTISGMQTWFLGFLALNLLLAVLSLKAKNQSTALAFFIVCTGALGYLLFIVKKSSGCINFILEECKSKSIELPAMAVKQAKGILFYTDAWEITLGTILLALILGVVAAIMTPNFNN
jgi:hypothetical protein